LLQSLPILEWKWEVITIDLITEFPRTTRKHDSIIVVVDKLKKDVHFIPVKLNHKVTNISEIYMKEIARIYGVPKAIMLEEDPNFTSNFWKGLFKGFGNNLNFSTTYHLDSNGKTEGINQIIEDMLRMYVIDKPSKLEVYLQLD
jgi:hypothetical protein